MTARTCWVYIRSEPGLYTVGFYDPAGKWHADSDHDDRGVAADRCAWLNGGLGSETHKAVARLIGAADRALGAVAPTASHESEGARLELHRLTREAETHLRAKRP